MPAPGEQHNGIANPFEEAKPRISTYTATEIATLQARLEKQLGPEYLSSRSGPSGQKVHYIAAEKCIALANEVFGFNGWSSSIQNIQVDFVDENPQTLKISLGLSVIVRITLRDGTYHEDIGYGHIENCKGKAAAFEKAKKEGTTDALKRALRNFGNVLGNCIYDKDYLAKVTKIKVGPTRFDEGNLHRHSDFTEKKPSLPAVRAPQLRHEEDAGRQGAAAAAGVGGASATGTMNAALDEEEFDDFDMADFGVTEDGHPDEVMLPASNASNINDTPAGRRPPPMTNNGNQMQPPTRPPMRNGANGPPPRAPQTPNQAQARPQAAAQQNRPGPPAQNQAQRSQAQAAQRPGPGTSAAPPHQPQQVPSVAAGVPAPGAPSEPVAFFSARSVVPLAEDAPPGTAVVAAQGARLFDAKLESPSIRKTPGIDHNKSRPLARNGQHVAPAKADDDKEAPASPLIGAGRGGPSRPIGAANPTLSQARQIGAPMMGGSPMGNRNQYRPPTIKRSAPAIAGDGVSAGGGGVGVARQALTDVSNHGNINDLGATGNDPKRQKMG